MGAVKSNAKFKEVRLRNLVWCVLGAVFAPFVVLSVWLLFTRWPHRVDTTISDVIALIMSVIIGGTFLAHLPLKVWMRVVLIAVYLPLGGVLVFCYSLYFVGIIFHDWL